MKGKRKTLALLLALALIMSLCACGSSSSSTESTTSTEETTTSAAAATTETTEAETATEETASAAVDDTGLAETSDTESADTVAEDTGYVSYSLPLTEENETLKIWFTDWFGFLSSYFESYSDMTFWQTLSEQTGIDFEFTVAKDDAVMILVASGESFDIIQNLGITYDENTALNDEYILDIAEYLDDCPNYKAMLYSDESYLKNAVTDDGSICAFYTLYSNAFPTNCLWIDQDKLNGAGINTLPKTIDEYHDALEAMTVEYGTASFWIGYSGGTAGSLLGSAYGINSNFEPEQADPSRLMMFVEDGEVKFSPYEEGFKSYLSLLNDWWDEGLVYKDFMTGTDLQGADQPAIQSGVALTSRSLSQYDELSIWSEHTWVAAYSPVLNEGDTLHIVDVNATVSTGRGWYIPTNCENLELALKLLDYFYSPEGQILSNYGFEGISMSYDANGEPVLDVDVLYNNEDFNVSASRFEYLGVVESISVYDYSMLLLGYDDASVNAVEVWTSNQDNEAGYPSMISLTTEETEALAACSTDVYTYISECLPKFIIGSMSVESDYDSFLENVKALGGDTILEIYQDAYDRYMAR